MATPIGTNQLNSLSRRHIIPQIVDNIYGGNLMFFRLNAMNKKRLQGGTQIEVPLNYSRFTAGGFYQGFDLLDVSPQDTVKNGAWDWKQAYVPVSIDDLTLLKADSPIAVVNFLTFYFENAQTELAAILGAAVWNDGAVTNTKAIDGLQGAIDDGGVATTYGGILRSSNTWWNCQDDSTTATLTATSMRSSVSAASTGGRTTTVIVGTAANYNRYWKICQDNQVFFTDTAGGRDEQLASAGFRNLLFDSIPFCVDVNVPANHIFYINEDYLYLYVNENRDFAMKEFREPINQDAMTALIKWAGNIIVTNCARQAKQSVLTA